MLQRKAVEPDTLGLLEQLMQTNCLQEFYLAGGTALALKFGHRKSVDLDFFCSTPFDTKQLADCLAEQEPVETFSVMGMATNSLSTTINGIKVEALAHRYTVVSPQETIEGIRMASTEDIAAMKLNAITNRGSKKDFFDLFELLQHFSLKDMLTFFKQKYSNYEPMMTIRSLSYFEDAEQEPDPISLKGIEWNTVKQTISTAVHEML